MYHLAKAVQTSPSTGELLQNCNNLQRNIQSPDRLLSPLNTRAQSHGKLDSRVFGRTFSRTYYLRGQVSLYHRRTLYSSLSYSLIKQPYQLVARYYLFRIAICPIISIQTPSYATRIRVPHAVCSIGSAARFVPAFV